MNRIFFNKNVLIALVIAMACCYVVAAAFYISASTGALGGVIDEQFMAALAQQEFDNAVGKVFLILAFFLTLANGLFALGFRLKKRRDKEAKSCAWGVLFFVVVGLSFSLYNTTNFGTRMNEKPFVQTEMLSHKDMVRGGKSGNRYYLYFSSGSKQTVSWDAYESARTRTLYHVVYQGNLVIGSFSAKDYSLAAK